VRLSLNVNELVINALYFKSQALKALRWVACACFQLWLPCHACTQSGGVA